MIQNRYGLGVTLRLGFIKLVLKVGRSLKKYAETLRSTIDGELYLYLCQHLNKKMSNKIILNRFGLHYSMNAN